MNGLVDGFKFFRQLFFKKVLTVIIQIFLKRYSKFFLTVIFQKSFGRYFSKYF